MSETTEKIAAKKTTIQISPEALLAVKNEQNRLLNLGQGDVTQGDLFNRAWECYRRSLSGGMQIVKGHSHNGATRPSDRRHLEVPDSLCHLVDFLVEIYSNTQIPSMENFKDFVMRQCEAFHYEKKKAAARKKD